MLVYIKEISKKRTKRIFHNILVLTFSLLLQIFRCNVYKCIRFVLFLLISFLYIYIYIWCGFKSRRGKNKNLTALKSNSNTVWFNFQTYIIFSINLVSLVTVRSSGTDILYGCHLLLDVCIIYFISCDCIMNSSLSYTIY